MIRHTRSSICRPASALAAIVLTLAVSSPGQERVPGLTATTIRLGSCSALEGPAAFLGTQMELGALAYFHMVNDQGGIYGRKIDLKFHDDSYDPDEATACFNRLKKEEVFAMGLFVGTAPATKYVPMAEREKIPVVGLFTGAQMLYEPVKRHVVNIRASYFDEVRTQVDSLWQARGVRKIGVIYQDDAFGKTVLEGIQHALAAHGTTPVALGTFPRNTLDVSAGLRKVQEARPDAVILVGPYAPVAAILKDSHATGWTPLFLTVSFVGTEGLIRAAGNDAEGVIITQVLPPYDRTDLPTIKLYRAAIDKYGGSPSFVSLEGFVDAMVMVEGLKRAGKDPRRESLIAGIESIHNLDIGLGPEFLLNFSPKDHKGFHSVYATIVRNGAAVALKDWKNLSNN